MAVPRWPGPEVRRAVTQISHECTQTVPFFPGLNTGFNYALALMNYALGHVSAANYAYLVTQTQDAPGSDPEDILGKQAGICGQAQIVFLAIGRWLGLPMRPVYIWFPEAFPEYTGPGVPGHATVEVSYGNTWHWFDPTWGFFFRDPAAAFDSVYSILDVVDLSQAVRQSALIENAPYLWTHAAKSVGPAVAKGSDYWFLDFTHLRIESPFGNVIYQR